MSRRREDVGTIPAAIKYAGLCALILVGVWTFLWGITSTADSIRVGQQLAQSQSEKTVMVCENGRINYEDDMLVTRLTEPGHFYCAEWRMRSPDGTGVDMGLPH